MFVTIYIAELYLQYATVGKYWKKIVDAILLGELSFKYDPLVMAENSNRQITTVDVKSRLI